MSDPIWNRSPRPPSLSYLRHYSVQSSAIRDVLPSLDVDARREQAQFVDVLQANIVDAAWGDVKVGRVVSELAFELRRRFSRTLGEFAA